MQDFWYAIKAYLHRKRSERLTLMIIPHGESKIINLQLSKLSIAFAFLIVASVVSASVISSIKQKKMKPQVSMLYNVSEEVLHERDIYMQKYDELSLMHSNMKEELANLLRMAEFEENKAISLLENEEDIDQKAEDALKSEAHLFSLQMEAWQKSKGQVALSSMQSNLLAEYNQIAGQPGYSFSYSSEVQEYRKLVLDMQKTVQVFGSLLAFLNERENVQHGLPYSWPSQGGHFTSYYGPRFSPFGEGDNEFHLGVDIANQIGTPIYAAADGTVISAGYSTGGYGNRVIINHKFGYTTVYAHMNNVEVRLGQQVKKGQLIGRVGTSGRSTGPHLHFEVKFEHKHINPLPFLTEI